MHVEIHTIASAAERAKVGPSVIRRWIAEGMPCRPASRKGKGQEYRITDSALLAWIDSGSAVEPEPAPAPERKVRPRRPAAVAYDPADPIGLRRAGMK